MGHWERRPRRDNGGCRGEDAALQEQGRFTTMFHVLHVKEGLQKAVIPAEAGIQGVETRVKSTPNWIPAFAGMTPVALLQSFLNIRLSPPRRWDFSAMHTPFLDTPFHSTYI